MGKLFDGIDPRLSQWIGEQPLFFVATAPLDPDGHVNVSPKGPIGTLQVIDPQTVAYLDLVGSGAETVAHVRENGRIVIMLCAFSGPPRIVRIHGRAEIISATDPEFAKLLDTCGFARAAAEEAERAIVRVAVARVADSCGYGVPLMSYEGQRPHMAAWADKKLRVGGADAILEYQREKNTLSIDGLPAVDVPAASAGRGA